jgi:hypothetical protein
MSTEELRAILEYIPGKTRTWSMTDSEIKRELETATGDRRDALQAEVRERRELRKPRRRGQDGR